MSALLCCRPINAVLHMRLICDAKTAPQIGQTSLDIVWSHSMRKILIQVLGDNPMRLSWGRSAVAARPAQLRNSPFSIEQFSSPYGLVAQNLGGYPVYSLGGQASGAPTSQIYGGIPQVRLMPCQTCSIGDNSRCS